MNERRRRVRPTPDRPGDNSSHWLRRRAVFRCPVMDLWALGRVRQRRTMDPGVRLAPL